ncbi:MAG: hypothetical protein KJ579_06280, partial [Verrucomicrobia bacterium]|nr:hypothetical protein [Verrucomicrobiota bacterium]
MALAESGLTHPDAGLHAGRAFGGRMVANGICLLVSDTVVLLLGLVVGDAILEYLRGIPFTIDRGFAIIPVWWAGAVVMRIVPGWGMSPIDLLRRTEVLLAAIFGIVLLAAFLLRIGPGLSRISILLAYAVSAAGIPLARAMVRSILIRRRSWGVSAAVYGRGDSVGHVIDAMRDEP